MRECSVDETIVDRARAHVATIPRHSAFTFQGWGGETITWDFETLDRRARAFAATLETAGGVGARALLALPPGLDYVGAFLGCLYAGTIAVTTYPPINAAQLARVEMIARDAGATLVVAPRRVLELLHTVSADTAPALAAAVPIAIERVPDDRADRFSPRTVDPAATACLQYTSGSTSVPKGVVVTHANIAANERMIETAFGHDRNTVGVGWLPSFHDMGLIGQLLQPLWLGVHCILLAPTTFVRRPVEWLRAISRYRGTTSAAPDFAYRLCADEVTDEEKAGLDLSSWSVAAIGAEPVRADTLERFAAAFASCGFRREAFYPCYGMAEATLIVSGGAVCEAPVQKAVDARQLRENIIAPPSSVDAARVLVGCGRAMAGTDVRIVNPATSMPLPHDRVGEIWIAGPHVTAGYFGQIGASRETFAARLTAPGSESAGPFLRSGDLGFLDEHGELFIVGRCKDLIIVRGRNHAPQDIELTVERARAEVRPSCVAAFSVEHEAGERVVIVAELRRDAAVDADAIGRAIRHAVALHHEVEVHAVCLVPPGAVAKTTSGKLQRQTCKRAWLARCYADATLHLIAP